MRNEQINKLVEKAKSGDKSALQDLYNTFFKQVYYYINSRVNSVHDAQEITSDVFLSMVEGISKYKGQSSFKNYLFGITKNKLKDYIRNKYKSSEYISESYFADESFENIVQEAPDYSYRNKLRKALDQIVKFLNPKYAKVLHLRFNQMNSVTETAELMGISTNNVKVIQHRAIKQASQVWEKLNEDIKSKMLGRKRL